MDEVTKRRPIGVDVIMVLFLGGLLIPFGVGVFIILDILTYIKRRPRVYGGDK